MFADLLPLYPLIVPFLLVLFRIIGMLVFAPYFNNQAIPGQVRALLALAMAFCVWNVVPHAANVPENLLALVAAVAGEMTVGLVIGLMLAAVFAGIQLGGHMISQQMGLSLATLYDPAFEDQTTVVEQIGFWIALVTFLAMGGHREIINAIVYSFQSIPMGSGGLAPESMMAALLGAMDASFHAAVRIAMPALVAFFIATLTSGLMSRSMPQINMMTVSVSVHLIVGFVMIGAGLAGWALVARHAFQGLFHAASQLLRL